MAGFRVRESALGTSGNITGRTHAVTGTVVIARSQVTRAVFRIDLASIRAPKQVQPDDKFRVLMDVIGDGLADKEFDISLDVWADKKSGPADKQVETPADLQIAEQLNASDKKKMVSDPITLIECEITSWSSRAMRARSASTASASRRSRSRSSRSA